jgi:hypothetical protein
VKKGSWQNGSKKFSSKRPADGLWLLFPETHMILFHLALFTTAAVLLHPDENSKTFGVKKIQNELLITGKGDDPLWKEANELSAFVYPWEKERAPFTSFKALHSNDWLYCLFTVTDENIITYEEKKDKTDVLNSDRVEIFFKQQHNTSPYYCLEMDPLGRVYDCQAEFKKKFNPAWSWPTGHLIIKTSRTKEGYIVEIAISKSSLNTLGLLQDKVLRAGLYRAECIQLVGNKATMKWISWIRPNSPTPDFHIPSSFGILTLE